VKSVALDGRQPLHRFLTPHWAHAPLSGAGAAANGGRFNRPGAHALYLATDVATAQAEYAQGALWADPGTHCVYAVRAKGVVDFSEGFVPGRWDAIWAEADCDWKWIARVEQRDPPSWLIGDMLLAAGAPGLLYPSTKRKGGICLVLLLDMLARSGGSAHVHDPKRRLPRDARSWP
jgi:RES domain-containing protein